MSHSLGAKVVLLAPRDPHPANGSWIVREWWGRPIIIGPGQIPEKPRSCTTLIYPILGPDPLLELIEYHQLGYFVCSCQFQEV